VPGLFAASVVVFQTRLITSIDLPTANWFVCIAFTDREVRIRNPSTEFTPWEGTDEGHKGRCFCPGHNMVLDSCRSVRSVDKRREKRVSTDYTNLHESLKQGRIVY
jgi:hypothetical protein